MSIFVTGTATVQCSMGLAPVPMSVLPKQQAQVLLPMAATLDNAPMANVPSFGMCRSLANPAVVAATAAALGVPTPGPCVPSLPAPWLPGASNVLVAGIPALTSDCKLMCAYFGVIQIVVPGQLKVQT